MHPRAVKVLEFSQGVRGKHQGRCGWCEECEFFFQTHWSVLYFSLPKWVCRVQTKPDFGHPRAKLISPTHKMCSSVLASKSAKRIQRNVCLAIPARTRQEGKKQNAKASKKKEVCDSGTTLSVYFDIHVPPVMDESWIHDWTHDWCCIFMTGRLGLINFARGGP